MSQPKSMKTNDELIEEFDQMLQKTKGTVEWTAIENYWRQALAQKDAEVAEAVKAQAEADQKAFQYWVETRLPAILQESIDHALTHPTKQTEAN